MVASTSARSCANVFALRLLHSQQGHTDGFDAAVLPIALAAVLAAGCSRPVCEAGVCTPPGLADGGLDAGVIDGGVSFFACAATSEPGTMDGEGRFCRLGSFCWYAPLPLGNDVFAIGGSSASDVWVAGGAGTLFRFCGTGVLNTESGTEQILEGVWSASPTDAWAVGYGGTALHWDGAHWRPVLAPDAGDLHAVWGAAPNDVWAVGGAGTVLRWDGTALVRLSAPAAGARLWSVHGTARDDVWIAGDNATLLHWDGQAFAKADAGAGNFRRVHALARDDVWVAGSTPAGAGLLVHSDGQRFAPSAVTTPDGGVVSPVVSLWGIGPTDVWAGTGLSLMHWDGAAWTIDSTYPQAPPKALWAPPGGDLVVGSYVGWVLRHGGGAFTGLTQGPQRRIYRAVWGSGPNDVWAGASGETGLAEKGLLHFDGRAWSWALPGVWIDDLHGSSATDVWAVGTDSYHWDGTAWTTHDLSFANNAVLTLGPNDAWSVGIRAKHWDGAAWTETPLPWATSSLYGVWGASSNDVWAAGLSGTIVRWNGSAWSKVGSYGANTFYSVWGSGKDDVYFVGDFGLAFHWNGAAVERLTFGDGSNFRRVTGTGPKDVWALGNFGHTWHFDGTQWLRVKTYSMRDPLGAWFTQGDGWIAGETGSLMRWRP